MRFKSQSGRTMLETMMVMGIIGVLSVTGIYMYRKGMNDVRADGIVKDVLARASQKKGNMDLNRSGVGKKLVYTPEYKKYNQDGTESEKTKGRYGYTFEIMEGATSSFVPIKATGHLTSSVCESVKSKIRTYKNGTFSKVEVVGGESNGLNILANPCPSDIPALKFLVSFGAALAFEPKPTPVPLPSPQNNDPCPDGATTDNLGDSTGVYSNGNECRCSSVAHWNGSSCVVCSAGENWNSVSKRCEVPPRICAIGSEVGVGDSIPGTVCKCLNANEYYDSIDESCKACPAGTSLTGMGNTAIGNCKCENIGENWNGNSCSTPLICTGDKVLNSARDACECPMGKVEKTGKIDECVECNINSDCHNNDYECENNICKQMEDLDDCRWGVCQTCENGRRVNLESNVDCEVGGLKGKCNGNGICYPTEGKACNTINGCPEGYFCNYGGNVRSGAMQRGLFGQTPNVCMKVNSKRFTYKNKITGKETTYFYAGKSELQSWCRAADNSPNCIWGYLAKPGAASWCFSLGLSLLTRNDLETVVDHKDGKDIILWDILKEKLPKTFTGYSYWIQEGAWTGSDVDTGRPDGYYGKGAVVCKQETI